MQAICRRWRLVFLLILLPLALAAPGCSSSEEPAGAPQEVAADPLPDLADHPNVLVIVWDTVRADRLSAYGYESPTTPYLEEFAREGRLYERAVSPGMWTVPSHASLFTGLPVSAHGANSHHKWLDHRFRTLAEIFRDAGYATYGYSANPHMSKEGNLIQGFEVMEHPWQKRWADKVEAFIDTKLIPEDHSNERTLGLAEQTEDRNLYYKESGPVTAEAFLAWTETLPDDRPFFAFLNYMEAHIPRIPSMEARKKLMDDETIELSLNVDQKHHTLLSYLLKKHEYTDEEMSAISQVYDATLIDLDEATQAVFAGLRQAGILDNTVVILTSDHGENLGEHRMVGHKYCVYNTLVRVPLVIRYPPRVQPGRVEHPAAVLDIFATALDLAGLPAPEPGFPSVSLFDETNARGPDDPIFCELVKSTPTALKKISDIYPDLDWRPWLRTFKSVEHGEHKFIIASDGRHELYNVVQDPGETNNLFADDPERAKAMGQSIDEWLTTFPPYDESLRTEEDEPGKLQRAVRKRLRALGYVN